MGHTAGRLGTALERWGGVPLVQGGNYQEKGPKIRSDDNDEDNHHDGGNVVDASNDDVMIMIKMMMIIRNKSVQ
jgi:hypothetical protein